MKPIAQFTAAVLALGGLLFQATSQATNLAEQPLKASVLAKPNVLFAMDDSGSMDAEVMFDGTFQGWFYGNYYASPLFPSSKLRNGNANYDWQMFYLFPNGTGTGNKAYTDATTSYGYAIPPTAEMAFARSNDYNPLYYSSTRTYEPWSPAYTTSSKTYVNATATAARSHPELGSTTMNLTANMTGTSSDEKFTFTYGMTVPSGATNIVCYNNNSPASYTGTLPYTVTQSRMFCKATVTYYPATFYKKENCGTVNGIDCVQTYDGQKL
jgi:type IV pilus assembly protein PilY1